MERTERSFLDLFQISRPPPSRRTVLFGLSSKAKRGIEKQIEENEQNAQSEKTRRESTELYGNGRWKFYGSNLLDYMGSFSKLCSLEDVNTFLQERKGIGRGVYALDFMGEGTVIRGLEGMVSGGAFVTLSDLRPDWKKAYDQEHNIHPVIGDVLLRDTWRSIDRVAEEFGGFDIVFCRPAGGLTTAFKDVRPYLIIFEKLLQTLKDDGGMLLTQIPNGVTAKVNVPVWILEMAHSYPNIEITYEKSNNSERCAWYALCLVKTSSPKRITSSVEQLNATQLVMA